MSWRGMLRALTVLCSCAVLFSGAGCSFAWVRPPVENAQRRPDTTCTKSVGPPVADTVIGGALLAAAVAGAAAGSQGCERGGLLRCFDRDLGRATAVAAGIPSLVFLGSAYYGYSRTSACRSQGRYAVIVPRDPDLLARPPASWSPRWRPNGDADLAVPLRSGIAVGESGPRSGSTARGLDVADRPR